MAGVSRVMRWAALGASIFALATTATPSRAETRGYVFSMIHMATYGGAPDNCPQGGNGTLAEIKVGVVMRMGYTRAESEKILAEAGGRMNALKDASGKHLPYVDRGSFNGKSADIANFPTSLPDPHIETVVGRYAYGFNLNGKVEDVSFEDPDTHEKGVDNNLWRALGCFAIYDVRLPVRPYSEEFSWDTAADAMPAWLLTVSGGDLSKDGDVTVTFDRSLDILMRDTKGGVMHNATFVVDPDPRSHNVFKGHIKDQVLTIEPGNFSMQGESQFYPIVRFTHAQLRLKLLPDGTIKGLLGGYQPWLDYYAFLAVRNEEQAQVEISGSYYAMKRLADGPTDPVTGPSISTAYWMEAVPSFNTAMPAPGKVASIPAISAAGQ